MGGGIFDEARGLEISRESRSLESSVMDCPMDSSGGKVIAEQH